jgi:putative transposase
MHVARGCQPRDASVELPILSQFRREEQLYRWRPRPDLVPLAGIPMVALCEEFGISRKTGHKIYQRYRQIGVQGLTDRSRRPHRHANQLPMVVEKTIVKIKREYPSWGAPKILERLRQRWPAVHCPAISTVHAVLDRHGLVTCRSRRVRQRLTGTPLSWPAAPNRLWCADDKGEFLLGNRRYCYPLTITDFASRYLLACEALSTTKERYAFTVFERAFQEHGLPDAIRTDNGVPFASAHALYGLSKLAVWWLRLGIGLERIAPGHPEQNGRHERLHLTLKTDATRPPSANVLQQQARFDTFVHQFNHERPHQALEMATPASRYQPSARAYPGPRGARVSAARLDGGDHDVRSHLLSAPQGQCESGVRRPEGRSQADRRPHLARHLHGL